MLPAAFSPAVPLGQASAPADPTGPPTVPAPASPGRRRPDDFADELDLALAGSAQLTANPPLPSTAGPDSNTPSLGGEADAAPAPLPASEATSAGGTTKESNSANAHPADEQADESSETTAAKPADNSANSAESDSSTTPSGATTTVAAQLSKVGSSAKAAPNSNWASSPPSAAAKATLPAAPATTVLAVTRVPNPPAATVPTHFPNAGQPTTAAAGAAEGQPQNTSAVSAGAAPAGVSAGTTTSPTLVGGPSANSTASPAAIVQALLTRVESAAVNGPSAAVSVAQVVVGELAAAAPNRGETTGSRAVPATGNAMPVGAYGATAPQAAATADGSPATPSLAEQIGNAIQAHLEAAPDQGRIDFHLRLDPPELGQVRVQLTLTDQTLTARLVAQDGATRQLIQSQMDTLRQRLQETGLGLGNIDVSGGGSGQGGQRQQPLPPVPDLTAGTAPPQAVLSPPATIPVAVGRVDLVA